MRAVKNWDSLKKENAVVLGFEVAGYALMAWAAATYRGYNKGTVYMVASFLLSLCKEASIVMLLIPKNQIKQKTN